MLNKCSATQIVLEMFSQPFLEFLTGLMNHTLQAMNTQGMNNVWATHKQKCSHKYMQTNKAVTIKVYSRIICEQQKG